MEAKTLDLLDWHGNGIVVGQGQELRFPIIVDRSTLSVLHWTFQVENGGIDFSVLFTSDSDGRNRMLSRRKHYSDSDEARGSIVVKGCVSLFLESGFVHNVQALHGVCVVRDRAPRWRCGCPDGFCFILLQNDHVKA